MQPPPPSFPPQQVMESGNYAQFLVENEWVLQHCAEGTECDIALFNLGFVYAYTQSPYRNLTKALQYFSELSQKYPRSPFAFQGQAWTALINDHLALEEARRQLQANLRNREGTIRNLRAQLNRSRAIDVEMEKKERELLR
jgi:TPR repeat protein